MPAPSTPRARDRPAASQPVAADPPAHDEDVTVLPPTMSRSNIVIDLNRRAQAQLTCRSRLDIVAGATHLFEEPGTLEQVAHLAAEWFTAHLAPVPTPAG